MRHKLKIGVSKGEPEGMVVACREARLGKRMMERLFGRRGKVAIIVPGDSVEDVTITESGDGKEGGEHGKDE